MRSIEIKAGAGKNTFSLPLNVNDPSGLTVTVNGSAASFSIVDGEVHLDVPTNADSTVVIAAPSEPPVVWPFVTGDGGGLSLSNSSVPANAPAGTLVGRLMGGVSGHTLSVTSGPVAIDGSGQVTLTAPAGADGTKQTARLKALRATPYSLMERDFDISARLVQIVTGGGDPTPPPPGPMPEITPNPAFTGAVGDTTGVAPWAYTPDAGAMVVARWKQPSHQRMTGDMVIGVEAHALNSTTSADFNFGGTVVTGIAPSWFIDTDEGSGLPVARWGHWIKVKFDPSWAGPGKVLRGFCKITASDPTIAPRVIGYWNGMDGDNNRDAGVTPDRGNGYYRFQDTPMFLLPRVGEMWDWYAQVQPSRGSDYTATHTSSNPAIYRSLIAALSARNQAVNDGIAQAGHIEIIEAGHHDMGYPVVQTAAVPNATQWGGYHRITAAQPNTYINKGMAFDPTNASHDPPNYQDRAWKMWLWSNFEQFHGPNLVIDYRYNNQVCQLGFGGPDYFGCGFTNTIGSAKSTYWNGWPHPGVAYTDAFGGYSLPCHFRFCRARNVDPFGSMFRLLEGCKYVDGRIIRFDPAAAMVTDLEALRCHNIEFRKQRDVITLTYTGTGTATITKVNDGSGNILWTVADSSGANGTWYSGADFGPTAPATAGHATFADLRATLVARGVWSGTVLEDFLHQSTLGGTERFNAVGDAYVWTFVAGQASATQTIKAYHEQHYEPWKMSSGSNMIAARNNIRDTFATTDLANIDQADGPVRNVAFVQNVVALKYDPDCLMSQTGTQLTGTHVYMDECVWDDGVILTDSTSSEKPSDSHTGVFRSLFSGPIGAGYGANPGVNGAKVVDCAATAVPATRTLLETLADRPAWLAKFKNPAAGDYRLAVNTLKGTYPSGATDSGGNARPSNDNIGPYTATAPVRVYEVA